MAKNIQEAPYPVALAELIWAVRYKPNWEFEFLHENRGQGSKGLTVTITITTPDSYHPEKTRTVHHLFPVPPAAYDQRSWQRWLFDQILLVERHEAMEFFQLVRTGETGKLKIPWEESVRPYAPSHGPGNDPYMIREVGTDQDVQTSYLGERKGGQPDE